MFNLTASDSTVWLIAADYYEERGDNLTANVYRNELFEPSAFGEFVHLGMGYGWTEGGWAMGNGTGNGSGLGENLYGESSNCGWGYGSGSGYDNGWGYSCRRNP